MFLRSGPAAFSYGPLQWLYVPPVSAGSFGLVIGWLSDVQGSKWPVSNSVLMSVAIAAHGMMLPWAAVEYSGSKLNGVPEQSAIDVFWKPLAADACMKPVVFWVKSCTTTLKALPPPAAGASNIWTPILSPGFMSSVSLFGVSVATSDFCGDGGPAGTP